MAEYDNLLAELEILGSRDDRSSKSELKSAIRASSRVVCALQTENTELRRRQQSALKVLRNSHLTIGRKSAWVRGILEGWSDDEETE